MKVGIVYDPIYLKHDTGTHVENSRRLIETMALLDSSQLTSNLVSIPPRAATVDEVALVHSTSHIAYVRNVSARGGDWLDGDTYASSDSYEVALYAAGGALEGVDAVMKGKVRSAFALVRPPGHHATRDTAMGFCLFNNIAIAAEYAKRKYNLERVLIADFDVHHGNGTEAMFNTDPQVLYFSTHQSFWYPGTGLITEEGSGAGKGFTVNVPLPAGCGDKEYLRVYREVLAPVAKRYRPQLILVSAGYDPHWADPLASMQVSVSGFAGIVSVIKELADSLCEGKLLLALEGGYHLSALPYSIKATFEVLLGAPLSPDPLGIAPDIGLKPDIEPTLSKVKAIHKLSGI